MGKGGWGFPLISLSITESECGRERWAAPDPVKYFPAAQRLQSTAPADKVLADDDYVFIY